MKLSFATLGCPTWTLERIATQASAMGFEGVELRGVAGESIGPEEPVAAQEQIRSLFRAQNVAIACISGYTRFAVADSDTRAVEQARLEKMIAVARGVDCPIIRIFGGHGEDLDRATSTRCVVESLKPLVEQAEKNGVRLALENHDDWCLGQQLAAILDGVNSPALGVCWDVANSFFVESHEVTFAAIRGRIIHVHFKDAARTQDRISSRLPGSGQVDLRDALRLLHEDGYSGYLSFEWEKKWEPDLEDPEIAFPHYLKYVSSLMNELDVPRG